MHTERMASDGDLALDFLRSMLSNTEGGEYCWVDLDGNTTVCLDGWVSATPEQVELLHRLYSEVRGKPYEPDR